MKERASKMDDCRQQLGYQLHRDTLTGLPNRKLLLDRFAQALRSAQRHRNCCAVFCVNIDSFKAINACYGYDGGDQALQQMAVRLRSFVRAVDTVAHLSADTFVVVAEGLERSEAAVQIASHINQ